MDKNQIMIQFLMGCPIIQEKPLFFNFAEEEDDTNHFVSVSDDENTTKEFVDGSKLKQYTFQIISYKSLAHNPIREANIIADENLENMANVRGIMEWINQQGENKSFPNFGNGYIIESMQAINTDPSLNGVDTSVDPPLAQYSITVRITYLDQTKMIWSTT